MTRSGFATKPLGATVALCLMAGSTFAEDLPPPVDQAALNALVVAGEMAAAFDLAFEAGDELTEASFDAARGVGANIGEGRLFTRFPRADLTGETEWANHVPARAGGANATSCIACHNAPIANGAGDVALNAVIDPAHTGDPSLYLERNTLPLFALAIPQRLAEEMSVALYLQRDAAEQIACASGNATAELSAKGIDFGSLTLVRTATEPCVLGTDLSQLAGIDADLVVRPFGWKGDAATIREFTRGAAHNELGMQADELVGAFDGDFDGVTGELTVGDMTALTLYMAALERPVSRIELAALGLGEVSEQEAAMIAQGEIAFTQAACASCHTPSMVLDEPIFSEPSQVPGFYDVSFPDGSDPATHGLTMATALRFDMTTDQPNNQFEGANGEIHHLGAVERDAERRAIAHWFTDLKRHDMGADLSDPSDPLGLGASMFLTRSLAGVGSTGPWLHDGRATTLDAAILAHGGAAQASRDAFEALPEAKQVALVTFLENLVIYAGDSEAH